MPVLKRLEKHEGDAKAQQLMTGLDSNKLLLNIFRGMANSGAALDAYLKFSGALKEGKLTAKEREAIALAIGQQNQCDYCVSAHTFIGKNAGLDDAATIAARKGQASDARLSAILSVATKVYAKKGALSAGEVEAARKAGLTDGDLAEIVANVALNLYTNFFNHLNQTEVDLPKVPLKLS